jgi:hypothetical protein
VGAQYQATAVAPEGKELPAPRVGHGSA